MLLKYNPTLDPGYIYSSGRPMLPQSHCYCSWSWLAQSYTCAVTSLSKYTLCITAKLQYWSDQALKWLNLDVRPEKSNYPYSITSILSQQNHNTLVFLAQFSVASAVGQMFLLGKAPDQSRLTVPLHISIWIKFLWNCWCLHYGFQPSKASQW